MFITPRRAAFGAVILSLAVAACNGSLSAGSGATPTLRVANLAYGAPSNFDVVQGTTNLATNLAYEQATAFVTTSTGGTTLKFEPTGTTTASITANLTVAGGTNYSVLALQGSAALTYLTVATVTPSLGAGQAQVSFVDAASAQGGIDIYVTSPTADLPLSPSQSNIAYPGDGATVTPVAFPITAGDYRIRAVRNGDTTRAIVFDSGPLVYSAGANPLMVFVPVSGSASSMSLVSLGSDSTVTVIADQRVQVRVGNFAPANGTVDTYFDQNGMSNGATTPFDTTLGQGSASLYQSLLPGAYHASFTVSGQTAELVGSDLTLAAGTSISVFAAGVVNQSTPYNLKLLVLHDDLRAPATGMAKLRVVHLSPDLYPGGGVDLVPISVSNGITTVGQTIIRNLAYAGASPYASVAPGSYTLALVPTGTQTPLLPTSAGVPVSLTANTVTTLVVAGCRLPSSGVVCATVATPLQFIQFTD